MYSAMYLCHLMLDIKSKCFGSNKWCDIDPLLHDSLFCLSVLTPSYESDLSNEYSPLRLTHVMNSIFLSPSGEFSTQAVKTGIPKQTLGLCFSVSK